MRIRLLSIATALALLLIALTPAAAVAAKPTQFSAYVFADVVSLEERELGNSGRLIAKEHLAGVIAYPTWELLDNATVAIDATTNYIQYPTGVREGVMRGRMVISRWNGALYQSEVAGTLELTYTARISGPGGMRFAGHWTAVKKTGVFQGINARGIFFADLPQGIPPTIMGTYN